jgi:GGDEF domain-containing protein
VGRAYNEFGSQSGDALLKGAAKALRERLRITDHLFRYSEREFVVVATGCNAADAHKLGASLLAAIDSVWIRPQGDRAGDGPSCDLENREDPELTAQPRVGSASLDPQRDSVDSLMRRARESLAASQLPGSLLTSSGRAASAAEPS